MWVLQGGVFNILFYLSDSRTPLRAPRPDSQGFGGMVTLDALPHKGWRRSAPRRGVKPTDRAALQRLGLLDARGIRAAKPGRSERRPGQALPRCWGGRVHAQEHLTTVATMYREMEMGF